MSFRNELTKAIKAIEVAAKKAAAVRDELRDKISDAEDILESLNEGRDSLEDGLREMKNGLATLSKYI